MGNELLSCWQIFPQYPQLFISLAISTSHPFVELSQFWNPGKHVNPQVALLLQVATE